MKAQNGLAVAVLVLLPAGAAGQTASPTTLDPPKATGSPQPQEPTSTPDSDQSSRWLASGFVGSNFANNADPASTEFGGSIGYLVKNQYGVEFDTGFTPDFELQNNFFGLGLKPQVNSFMANAIWARPIGAHGRWQPFISGGGGAITLRSGMDNAPGSASPNDTRFGGNIGGGLMGFTGHVGFKADVRYYRATGSYNTTATTTAPGQPNPQPPPPGGGYTTASVVSGSNAATAPATGIGTTRRQNDTLASAALSGLHFWRANVGLAVRF